MICESVGIFYLIYSASTNKTQEATRTNFEKTIQKQHYQEQTMQIRCKQNESAEQIIKRTAAILQNGNVRVRIQYSNVNQNFAAQSLN